MSDRFWIYLFVMAGVTYLVRSVPLLLIKREIKNRFILSFLHYIPFSVLTVMTIPAIFYSTSYFISAVVGLITALILAYKNKGLTTVAIMSCASVLLIELLIRWI